MRQRTDRDFAVLISNLPTGDLTVLDADYTLGVSNTAEREVDRRIRTVPCQPVTWLGTLWVTPRTNLATERPASVRGCDRTVGLDTGEQRGRFPGLDLVVNAAGDQVAQHRVQAAGHC